MRCFLQVPEQTGRTRGVVFGAAVLLTAVLFPTAVPADNCFINGSSVAVPHPTSDPAPSVFTYNGVTRVYFYCTQDIIGGSGSYPIDTIHCYSSSDMFHWKDDGVSLGENHVSWASANVHKLWAPHVVFLKGLYRLIVPETSTDGQFYNFVATSANPVGDNQWGQYTAGPRLPGSVTNVIDPFIFIDITDSTRVWLSYRHQNGSDLGFVRMNDSASAVTGNIANCIVNTGAGSGYKEGSWMWKRNGIYFLVFAFSPSGNEIIGYSTAHNASGPWTYRGELMVRNAGEWTIHSGACEYNNQWYFFWHDITFGGSIFGNERCSGIEYQTYSNDSTIAPIPKTNRGVGVPNAYTDTIQVDRGVLTGAASAAWAYNAGTTEARASWYITNITNNASVRYDSVDFTPPAGNIGPTFMSIRVAGTSTGGTIAVHTGSTTGPLLGTVTLTSTGSLSTWATQAGALTGTRTTGKQNLYLVFTTPTANTFNINWVRFGYSTTGTRQGTAQEKSAGLSCQRTGKDLFVIDVPQGSAVSAIRIFNLRGQEIAGAFSSSASPGKVTVNLSSGTMASGSYMLSVQSRNGELRVPFAY